MSPSILLVIFPKYHLWNHIHVPDQKQNFLFLNCIGVTDTISDKKDFVGINLSSAQSDKDMTLLCLKYSNWAVQQ
jgi:hypothetical protein